MKDLTTAISEFLFFGFIPNEFAAQEHLKELETVASRHNPFESLGAMKEATVGVVDELLPRNENFVVPVSSGLDSRGLLGAALACRPTKHIFSYTFGHPGAVDYELASNLIAGATNNHFLVDVSKKRGGGCWDTDTLVERVSTRPADIVLAVGETGLGLTSRKLDALRGLPSLIGYLGDSISGKKLNSPPDTTWSSAVTFFIKKNRPYKGPTRVTHPDFNPLESFPESSTPKQLGHATLNDELDWGYRQQQRVAFFVGALRPASQSLFPYAHPAWRGPWLHERPEERMGQRKYREFLASAFP